MRPMQQLLSKAEPGILFATMLAPRISYSVKADAAQVAGSIPTAYRRLHLLESIGLATIHRGQFKINRAVLQPPHVLEKLVPSLLALKTARRFGRKYHVSDINFLKNNLPKNSFITLDYKAWELTKYQLPQDLYVYVDDIDKASNFLKSKGFSHGNSGHIILLQKHDDSKNTIEQVYLDCIAKGGRNILDAIAIELKHGDKLNIKGKFSIDDILKVQDDIRTLKVE